jgi:sigma-B regulation protein RsbU (phosphoserine phosphatase)
MFTTAFIGCYAAETRLISYASAGHSPVIYCRAGAKPQLITANDVPVGVIPSVQYHEQVLPLAPGDILIIATDGFSEAGHPQTGLFGYERLLLLTEQCAQRSARDIGESLLKAVSNFDDTHPQSDDRTIVVLKGVSV